MRKYLKFLSVLLALIMCISLCGCKALDELRESRASLTESGTIKLPDGTEYKLLPKCEELHPDFKYADTVYVADEELPLLLTVFSDKSYSKSNDGMFLTDYLGNGETVYCRTDVYNNVLDRINGGFVPEAYGYWYYDYSSDEERFYLLTESQAEAVSEVYRTQTPTNLPEAASLDYEYMVDLLLCTSDKLFMRDSVDVCVLNDKYYVVGYDFDTTSLYAVPDNLKGEFAALMKACVESEQVWADE